MDISFFVFSLRELATINLILGGIFASVESGFDYNKVLDEAKEVIKNKKLDTESKSRCYDIYLSEMNSVYVKFCNTIKFIETHPVFRLIILAIEWLFLSVIIHFSKYPIYQIYEVIILIFCYGIFVHLLYCAWKIIKYLVEIEKVKTYPIKINDKINKIFSLPYNP